MQEKGTYMYEKCDAQMLFHDVIKKAGDAFLDSYSAVRSVAQRLRTFPSIAVCSAPHAPKPNHIPNHTHLHTHVCAL